MVKSSQKTAGAGQPANQRGKSRFGSTGRTARVVLPERPPRAVDNEIVSILLGADPASLTAQAEDVNSDAAASPVQSTAVPPATLQIATPAAPPTEDAAPPQDFGTSVTQTERASREPARVESKEVAADGHGAQTPAALPFSATIEAAPITPARPAERAARAAAPIEAAAQGGSISSFEEFAERWKHGLRKGQLKICEVLYEKTYAVGRAECVTSFSELGRLSGLKMRQCFNIIAQLEALKFVERARSANTSNKKDQGSVIRFYLFPVQ
jgi:hypothetical protein